MNTESVRQLMDQLLDLPHETEWVEFKHNNDNPEEVGEYISALSNSATLHQKDAGYLVWGIDAATRDVVGTSVRPKTKKIGNEELENWLARLLTPRIDFRFHELDVNGMRVVLLVVQPANHHPVRFRETEYIRIGSYKKKLKDYPEKERQLWALFAASPFERGVARTNVSGDEVLGQLDYHAVFKRFDLPVPHSASAILDRLAAEALVIKRAADRFDVTNLGAVLFARDLATFDRLKRKLLRVVIYEDKSRLQTKHELSNTARGYASGFEDLMTLIVGQLPQTESVGAALRRTVAAFPTAAVRELVANALIHQDFNVTGAGPMVEVFSDRIEFSNPGTPLVDVLRFIDARPVSRNESLAAAMRRVGFCEERGSGIDKVIAAAESMFLPAPDFQVVEGHTVAILYGHRNLSQMDAKERARACYQHACLCYVSRERMSNTSLRVRFALTDKEAPKASRIIAETMKEELIRQHDPESGKRYARYVPFWA